VDGLPFAGQVVFSSLLFKVDAVMLSLMSTEAAVGLYGAAYRLFESTWFLTNALAGAFLAMYTYLDTDTEPTVGSVFGRSIKFALVTLAPVAVVFGVLAEPLSELFFGADFADAAEPLRLLAPVVVLLGVVVMGSSLMLSRGKASTVIGLTASMALFNIALNLALIPAYEEAGAAAAMLLTELVFGALVLAIASRRVGGLQWGSMLAPPALAALAMVLAMLPLRSAPAASLGVGTAVYVAAYVLLERLISPPDLAFVLSMIRRRVPRLGRARA
jgi:O-antigen/teichoic acid export membrane protein